jgi:hypothetical protein
MRTQEPQIAVGRLDLRDVRRDEDDGRLAPLTYLGALERLESRVRQTPAAASLVAHELAVIQRVRDRLEVGRP